jgi:hypothetical protein
MTRGKPRSRARGSRTGPKAAPAAARSRRRSTPDRHRTARLAAIEVEELDSLREEIDRLRSVSQPPRWNANPDDVRRSVAKLVLTLVDFVRQLLERQAVRRMEAGTLTAEETESVGLALMRLEEAVQEMAGRFGLDPSELSLDLGPIGRLK